MTLNPLGVMSLLAGIVLLYAAVKNKYPQDVLREAMGKPAIHGKLFDPGAITGQARPIAETLPPATGTVIATI